MDRRDRLDTLLDEHGLEAVWFAQPTTFAWLTGGDNVVARGGETGVAAVGYDGDDLTVLTNNIEAQRLRDEEVGDLAIETYQWHESALGAAIAERTATPAGADFAVEADGIDRIDPSTARIPLTAEDIAAYRTLARETAAAVEAVARDLEATDTEREVAAALRVALYQQDIEAPVALVGGSERAQAYRHYTPKDEPLGDYALLSVTAQRGGLHTSCTRSVAFDPPDWLDARHDAAATVETAALAATQEAGRSDGTAADVFGTIQAAYAETGHEGEWRHHHQGGAAGYAGREWKATPTLERPVRLPMAFAYNPTVQGAKSEDTVLIREDDIDVLSETGAWPTKQVTAPTHDLTLERPAILQL
jgi:Xaa-Pro aminopeptidase